MAMSDDLTKRMTKLLAAVGGSPIFPDCLVPPVVSDEITKQSLISDASTFGIDEVALEPLEIDHLHAVVDVARLGCPPDRAIDVAIGLMSIGYDLESFEAQVENTTYRGQLCDIIEKLMDKAPCIGSTEETETEQQ
jgi:coenzyme F420-reducing hydrogenase gamma subunit